MCSSDLIAYKLKENNWRDSRSIELEVVSIRLPVSAQNHQFNYQDRNYGCSISDDKLRITIINEHGGALVINKGKKVAELISASAPIESIDITKPFYFDLIKSAMQVLDS